MEPVVSFFQRLIPGASTESISRSLGVIIAVALLVVSTAIALTTGAGNSGDGNDGSSEDAPAPGVLQPGDYLDDVFRSGDDIEIRRTLLDHVAQSRATAGLPAAFANPTLATQAQEHAQSNARKGSYTDTSDTSVTKLQARLPYDDASADNFYHHWLERHDSHCALASTFDSYGVGVASANGETFAVIYIRDITEQHDACKTQVRSTGNEGSS